MSSSHDRELTKWSQKFFHAQNALFLPTKIFAVSLAKFIKTCLFFFLVLDTNLGEISWYRAVIFVFISLYFVPCGFHFRWFWKVFHKILVLFGLVWNKKFSDFPKLTLIFYFLKRDIGYADRLDKIISFTFRKLKVGVHFTQLLTNSRKVIIRLSLLLQWKPPQRNSLKVLLSGNFL